MACAFLQGSNIDDDQSAHIYGVEKRCIYLTPPSEFRQDGKILRLNKAVYGYSDAPRRWFRSCDRVLKSLGFQPTELDPAAYVLKDNGKAIGILCMHVDDIFMFSNARAIHKDFIRNARNISSSI